MTAGGERDARTFISLPLEARVRVLKVLCDYHLYWTSRVSTFLRDIEHDDLRVETFASYGTRRFFYFPQFWSDCRLCVLGGKARRVGGAFCRCRWRRRGFGG